MACASGYCTVALDVAVHKGLVKTVRRLLEKGAGVGTYDVGRYTALHCASGNRDTGIMELLLGKVAYINQLSKLNSTPLDFAVTHSHVDAVGLLLSRGADPLAKDNITPFPVFLLQTKTCLLS